MHIYKLQRLSWNQVWLCNISVIGGSEKNVFEAQLGTGQAFLYTCHAIHAIKFSEKLSFWKFEQSLKTEKLSFLGENWVFWHFKSEVLVIFGAEFP